MKHEMIKKQNVTKKDYFEPAVAEQFVVRKSNFSDWIVHVKQYAKDNNVPYFVALQEASKTYKK